MAVAAARALWHRDRLEIADPAPFTADVPEVRVLREAAADANLVICVIDAARADHVGCYGYPRDTTPNIDRIAQESLVFERHFAQYATTKPSTASLFTSQHADTHLAYESRPLLEGTFTLAKGLAGNGFATVMFSSNPNAAPATGLGLDFQEVYDQTDVEPLVDGWEEFTLPQPLLSLIESWLQKNARRRFFAYIHFDPPHQPYLQPDEMTQMLAGQRPPTFVPGHFEFPVGDRELLAKSLHPPLPEWIDLYDANLRFADWAVGELVRLLREADVFERTVLVVSADHGEAFGEHGYLWHERGVYDELVQVPLVLRLPGGAGAGEVAGLTQTIDLLPTMFDLFEVSYPRDGIQGTSLLPLMAGMEDRAHDYVMVRSDGRPPSYLVRGEEWALMLWGNGEWRALYDLARDPEQRTNVIEDYPEVAEKMLAQFRRFAIRQRRPPLEFIDPNAEPVPVPESGAVELSPEVKQQLRALGYVR